MHDGRIPNSVQAELRNEVTWPKNPINGRLEDQHFKDCLGKAVGSVSANFDGLYRKLLESRSVKNLWYVLIYSERFWDKNGP